MITHNKLANQPENKLTKKFRPVDMEDNVKKPSKIKIFVLLPVLLILVAGGTFGIFYLINHLRNNFENSEVAETDEPGIVQIPEEFREGEEEEKNEEESDEGAKSIEPITSAASSNPTIKYGRLMLINPNFMVETSFIAARKTELISVSGTYGIKELHSYNGDNLLDKEAAAQLNQMLADYSVANPGHAMQTVSCFRSVGTNCGRLCAATGASDHHTGLTCDLIDPVYGTSLDTDTYDQHIEWQWLYNNSYKYGFIDRFPEAWAGGSMDEPLNVNAEGSTGLYETWHYRYVGVYAATEIATGKYNNEEYDSLEHYLKARGLVLDLLDPSVIQL